MLLKCTICQDHHSSAQFKFFPCGHGFCSDSLDEHWRATSHRGRSLCPICRMSFRKDDAHSIYMDSEVYPASQPITTTTPDLQIDVDADVQTVRYPRAVLKQAAYTSDSIRRMTINVTADNVEKVGNAVRQVAEGLDRELCSLETLLSAMADFWLRIVPIFSRVAEKEKEAVLLNNTITSLKSDLKTAARQKQQKIDEALAAEKLAEQAVETADQARHEFLRAREEVKSFDVRMETLQRTHRKEKEERDDELRKLRDTLIAHKKKEAKQQERIMSLRLELKEKDAMVESLQRSAARSTYSSSSRSTLNSDANPNGAEDTDVVLDSDSDLGFSDPEPESETACFPPSRRGPPPGEAGMAPPKRPQFPTDWNLSPTTMPGKRKRVVSSGSVPFPIALDPKGRTKGVVQLGSRQKLNLG